MKLCVLIFPSINIKYNNYYKSSNMYFDKIDFRQSSVIGLWDLVNIPHEIFISLKCTPF